MKKYIFYIMLGTIMSFLFSNCNGSDVVDDSDITPIVVNQPPVIEWAKVVPAIVQAGMKYDLLFKVKVSDTDGIEDLVGTMLDLRFIGNEVVEMINEGDSVDNPEVEGIFSYTINHFEVPENIDKLEFQARTMDKNKESASATFVIDVKPKDFGENFNESAFEINVLPEDIHAESKSYLSISLRLLNQNNLKYIKFIEVDFAELAMEQKLRMLDDAQNADGIFNLVLDDFNSPNEEGNYNIKITVTSVTGSETLINKAIIIKPKPVYVNTPPQILNQSASPAKVIFGKQNRIVFNATVYDADGLEDIVSVTINLSSLGLSPRVLMFDDGKNEDGEANDGVFGVVIENFRPPKLEDIQQLIITATDTKQQTATQAIDFIIEIPEDQRDVVLPQLATEKRKAAPEEISRHFKPFYKHQNTKVFKDEKEGTIEVIIKDEHSWNPRIVGFTGFQEGGVRFAYPREWVIERKHNFEKSRWILSFDAGYIDIEMLPYRVGDQETLKNWALERRDELQKQYEIEMKGVEFDKELRNYEGFLGVKALRLNFYLSSKETENLAEGETINHSLYFFNAREETSQPTQPVFRTFKIEYWQIPSKITSDGWQPFVDNFRVE